jgi:putative ABC transport system substrate-binding protein
MFDIRRREFITLLGSTAVWPALAHAQQPPAIPVIGFLHGGSPEPNARRLAGFRKGLSDAGLVEGRNVAIEFRWAEGKNDRLADMAADLIEKRVAVIATLSSTTAAVAAKKATSTIPIYFLIADPPVELGLVTSLNRPGGNATGIITLAAEVAAKRFSLLRELVPQAAAMAALVQPSHPSTKPVIANLQAAARTLAVRLCWRRAPIARSSRPTSRSSPASPCWSAPTRSSSAVARSSSRWGRAARYRRSMTAANLRRPAA